MKAAFLVMMVVMLCMPSITVYAQTQVTELSKLMVTKTAVEALEEPSEQSKTTITYEAGASVMVTGETADGWYRVAYQDKVGFVKKTDLEETDINIAALDEEFGANEIDGKIFVEEVVRIREQITRSRIWGTIIVLLIAGIFGTGIYSTIKSEQKKKQNEPQNDNMEMAQQNVELDESVNEKKEKTNVKNEDEMIEPLSFGTVEMEPLDIMDLDEQES